jgi:hypothetical protein
MDELTAEAEEIYKQMKAEIAERRKGLKEIETKKPERIEKNHKACEPGIHL